MNRHLTVAVCSVALLLALVSLWLRFKPGAVRIPQDEIAGVNTGLGQVLGEETVKVVPNNGRVVVVAMATLAQLQRQPSFLWNAFARELQQRKISISADESMVRWDTGSPHDTEVAFKKLFEQHADADAFVFLVDLPEWFSAAGALPEHGKPTFIAIDHLGQRMRPRYSGYFANGHLAALIGARSATPPAAAAPPRTPREWFDLRYQVYTPENYETMPPP